MLAVAGVSDARFLLHVAGVKSASPPPLARELLVNLALLVGAALSLAVLTTLVSQALQPSRAVLALLGMIVADLAVLFFFGRHLVRRLVLAPLQRLAGTADALAAGDLRARAPAAETAEFTRLAERLNVMTEHLLDAQAELVHAEKLAGVGRLAAGIAHEVGNPLAAVRTYLDVLRRRGADDEITTALLAEVERIDRIVRGLLDYARPQAAPEGPMEVGQLVERVLELLAAQGVLRGHQVTVRIAPGLPRVRGRAGGLEQVLVNLVLNAVDAAPGGALSVESLPWAGDPRPPRPARRTDPDDVAHPRGLTRRTWRSDLDAGHGVMLVVADSGPGVPAADRERIFDPFVTTKDPGKGTGLGLAVVQRVIHEMGGVVWVDDAREGGAAFKVVLPAA